jgi:hypothetical protein
LIRYILRDTGDNPRGVLNSKYFKERMFLAETESAISRSINLKVPVTHFVLSFPEEEKKKGIRQCRESRKIFLAKDADEHRPLCLWGAHRF